MNGLTLRISRGGGNKSKNSIGFSPVNITTYNFGDSGTSNGLFKDFANADTTDGQIAILKKIIDQYKDVVDTDVIQFMVAIFLQAEPKHPVKCFITRHVTKNSDLQQPFTDALASKIIALVTYKPSHYKGYADVVSKVATCIENFNAGVAAIRFVEIDLGNYLNDCLTLCITVLRETKSLSPTEKNEIFTLSHLSLRLLLHIIQKGNDDSFVNLRHIFNAVRLSIQQLMFDDDVPMDTKSVCGILYLSMHVMRNGPNSWVDILKPGCSNPSLVNLLEAEASELCLYTAVVTVVSVDKLQSESVEEAPAIVTLMRKILHIGERSSSESTFILGTTRSLLQISKLLERLTDSATGQVIVDSLLLFTWAHLDHYMDSVRHLTAQMLATVVRYCAKLDKEGDGAAVSKLLSALHSLDPSRKSYYAHVTCLAGELGAERLLRAWPALVPNVMRNLSQQHVQASATTTLETLLQKHAKACSTEELHEVWVSTILSHVGDNALDSSVLHILENLLVSAVKLDKQLMDYIIPYIKQSCDSSSQTRDLKCIIMLLSVARKSGISSKLSGADNEHEWKGIISYDVLKMAAIDAVDETRILSLSLIVESPKTTEEFTIGDLSFVLYYLKYNINAQAPNFRQLTLSVMKKFIKRLEDSYKVIKRQKEPNTVNNKVEFYLRFVDDLRQQCFDSLLQEANYSRRYVALQLLVWCEKMQLEGYDRKWKADYVEKLLRHLEDSYENNKMFALEVLSDCPTELIKGEVDLDPNTYLISIFTQASSLKPTDCVSAAYKLDFLRRKLPEYIYRGNNCSTVEPVSFALIQMLLRQLSRELRVCMQSVVLAARSAPMYGVLHCITHLMTSVDPQSISSDVKWTSLIKNIIDICSLVNKSVASVVNNSSPEGHLPMDMSGVVVTDDGNTGGVVLDDGRQVTAQMVLLCAWRSVKEVSLLLGLISSRLTIENEDGPVGTLTCQQLEFIGEHFTTLLAETKHRGAFEQAYVGFTKLLARLWRCRDPSLHSLPRSWLAELTHTLATGDKKGYLCATRRSAGLPFMIQALVTTELQVQGNPKCFHSCMTSLLSLASRSTSEEARCHALNILRALFRNAALDESVAGYVGRGLMIALCGFERDTWAERNSSTLLFSALMVRVFGVARARHALCLRNTMTGRIFFLRYPQLYDFMLEKLKEVSSSEDTQVLRPSLYPVLLLLARLYPSSLEGTVSNLKLVAFIPHVLSCARSGVLKTRQLAARAMVPLISPELYTSHIQSMFALLKPTMKRNYCHGVLLQLTRLLDCRPEDLQHLHSLTGCVEPTLWILEQAVGSYPCYLIADEYVKVLNLVAWRFPFLLHESTVRKIQSFLYQLIFNCPTPRITSGRDICLSNAIYLYFILLNGQTINIRELVYKGLEHSSYEVILSTLNFLLVLHNNLHENKCKFLEHLSFIANKYTYDLNTLKDDEKYMQLLCKVLTNEYLECQQKSLKILTLEDDTQKCILQAKFQEEITDENVIGKLFECLRNEHENLTHLYLESLLNFVSKKLNRNDVFGKDMLNVIRVIFEYSSSDNSESTRNVVVGFIEKNLGKILRSFLCGLGEDEIFELKATLWSTIITLLEDDEESLRQRISDCVTSQCRVTSQGGVTSRVLPAACAEHIRDLLQQYDSDHVAMFIVIGLLDFKSVVVTDEGNDECRVFDQNERYNIFLEETVWTSACADKILAIHGNDYRLCNIISDIIDNPVYNKTFVKLCNDTVMFKNMLRHGKNIINYVPFTKIELFCNKLRKSI